MMFSPSLTKVWFTRTSSGVRSFQQRAGSHKGSVNLRAPYLTVRAFEAATVESPLDPEFFDGCYVLEVDSIRGTRDEYVLLLSVYSGKFTTCTHFSHT